MVKPEGEPTAGRPSRRGVLMGAGLFAGGAAAALGLRSALAPASKDVQGITPEATPGTTSASRGTG